MPAPADGYALIRKTPNSVRGYWFIKAYGTRAEAEKDRIHNPGSKIKAIRFITEKVTIHES
jgi:hypothetical protein